MLSIKNLVKVYKPKKANPVTALDHINIDFADTGLVFLLGKSGSGKSTLLNTIGGLDEFDDGEIIIKGKSSKEFSSTDFDSYRNTFIGFIFQEYNVLEEFTVAKNLALAVELQGKKPNKEEIDNLLEQVDMLDYAKRKPNQLSGGQKQRIAIARALIKNPEIIMADEPTGALDSNTGKQVMETLKKLSKDKLVIIVSHDREFAEEYGDRIIELKDGKIIKDVTKKEVPSEDNKGVKIIDNNLIIIKKGKELTKENLKTIEEAIKQNLSKEDVIISLDKTSNDKVKNASSINNSGNKESFLKTTEEDVKLKQYNKKDLQLIKSRLKNKDAFKMGASGLKHKKAKLFFTILLSVIAFVMFGVVDTFSCFNIAQSTCDTVAMVNPAVVSISKASYGKYQQELTEDDLFALRNETNKKFYPVKAVGNYTVTIDGVYGSSRNPMFEMNISGVMALTPEVVTELGTNLLGGRCPTSNDEAVITKHIFDCYGRAKAGNETYTPSTDYEGFATSNKKINTNNKEYKIVGVIDDKVDFSKYETSGEGIMQSLSWQEANKIGQYGFSNICFVTENEFAKTKASNDRNNNYYVVGDSLPEYSYLYGDFIGVSNIYKTGVTADTVLTGNQIKITTSLFEKLEYNGTAKQFLESANTKIKIKENEYSSYTEYEVVAITNIGSNNNDYGRETIYSNNLFNNYWYYFEKLDNSSQYTQIGLSSRIQIYAAGETFTNVTYKPGFSGELTGNQIIISNYVLSNLNYMGSVSDFLSGNTTIKIYYDYDKKCLFNEFEIVGITNDSSSQEIYTAEGRVKKGDYSYVVTKAGDPSVIRSLNSAFVKLTSNGTTYKFEDKSTVNIDNFGGIIETLTSPLLYVSLGLALFSALFLSSFISNSISYKKREIGILRAIGARGWDVFKIFFYESFLISGITYLISLIGTFVASFFINRAVVGGIGIALLSFGLRQVGLMLAITLLIAIIATFLPVRKIAKKNPIDAINNR